MSRLSAACWATTCRIDHAMKFNVSPSAGEDQLPGNETDHNETARLDSLVQEVVQGVGDIEERVKRWFGVHTPESSFLDPNYLRKDLLIRLGRLPIRYTLSVQIVENPASTPIEDALREWTETDSPSIPVADLELNRESTNVDNESLRFSPAHFISTHRPLGNLARGRLFTYTASQDGRGASTSEPEERVVFRK